MLKIMFKSKLIILLFMTSLASAQSDSITIPQSLLDQVEKGNAETAYFIASQFDSKNYKDDEFYPKAKQWMLKAAEMGYPQAMYELAQMFAYEELENKALNWYIKASEYGHAEAIYSIASIYIRGKSDEPSDCLQAYQWYKKAEAKDSIVAYNDHAWSLATSSERKCRNPERALKIFSKVNSHYQLNAESMPSAYRDTQAAVHAAVSDFNMAIEIQQSAVDDLGEEHPNRSAYIERLESYKQRKAWKQK